MLNLAFSLTFSELYSRDGVLAIDRHFLENLHEGDAMLHQRLLAARAQPEMLGQKEEAELLLAVAPHLEDFIAHLFSIQQEVRELAEKHHALAPLYVCKRLFVQRRAAKAVKEEEAKALDGGALAKELAVFFGGAFDELTFARQVMQWQEAADRQGAAVEEALKQKLDLAARYAAWALYSPEGKHAHAQGVLFKIPRKLDAQQLIAVETELRDGVTVLRLPEHHYRHREGFALTDAGPTLEKALDETNYCIWCHHQGKDSCSKGMREKSGEVLIDAQAPLGLHSPLVASRRDTPPISSQAPRFKKNPLDITLAGCPLEEKISEMNELKSAGVPLGALAVAVVDNAMIAGTGHRICNDCMKACIYQKQEPVNIPLAETQVLGDVLRLPYGFEIYSLLTRWNPLNLVRPMPRSESGYKVLVAGLGPAGYTLAHHLMNDGHTVVGIDGLKIEPLPPEISGVTASGERVPFEPIRDIAALYESLDERVLAGFGGVAEYGITVRWDKNYLKIIRLLLERRAQFAMFAGVRFGSALTCEGAFALGFDHIALCMGAGRPTVIEMENALARGVRTASDFLMSLQLTGAAKVDSIANLQLRLPVVVIGGGLTAIDTATESLAYYPVQVEKFLARYEALGALLGEDAVRARWNEEEREIAEEFLAHAKAIRAERALAESEERESNLWRLLDGWGGVKLVYRKRLIDAPSYRLNHEEVEKAFEEGIFFTESLEPAGVLLDRFGHARAIRLKNAKGEETVLPARSILIAAGTSPNTVLSREDPLHFSLDGKYFRSVDENGAPVSPERVAKPAQPHVLMHVDEVGRSVSFFGDLHPSFAGNVVKAMASAKQGHSVVTRALARHNPSLVPGEGGFLAHINGQLRASVHEVIRLTPNIVEVIVHAPLAARAFQPGQFYRLQNYEAFAAQLSTRHSGLGTTLAMEGLALTGAWVDREKGLVSLIVLEMGGSSDLCAYLKPGEPVVLMGPTGTPTEIPEGETVLLAGGGLGNAVLFSIGKALREAGSKVLYFAGYKKAVDRYKVAEIEAAADIVVWCCDESRFTPGREQDKSFHGNIVEAMRAYAAGELGEGAVALNAVDRIIAIGSDKMMAAVGAARHGVLKPYLKPCHVALGSINSPMQCMMKEICAQCLQKHVDPATGEERYVYSCFNQDQALDEVSFTHLDARLRQNSVQEKLTALWVDACLKKLGLRKAA